MTLNLLPAFYPLGWDFLVQFFTSRCFVHRYRARAVDRMVPLVSNGHTDVQLNSPALPDFIDETKTKKENRI